MKMWMIAAIEGEPTWPSQETQVLFEGFPLLMRPPQGDSLADVRLLFEHPKGEREAHEVISRFLSALSWYERRPVRVGIWVSCTAPMRGGRSLCGPHLSQNYRLPEQVQEVSDPKTRLALALYREAVSVGNTPYEFLGYFKIINVRYPTPKEQIAWINNTISLLSDRQATKRAAELSAGKQDVGAYLYGSGRCAVAHAGTSPVVDPDSPDDILRLSADMPLARALAEYLIEREFGVRWQFSQ